MWKIIIDQTGKALTLEQRPQRIISVVPSQTELLFDLGLDQEVVGITKFCVHPETWYRSKVRVGGTKTLDIEKIRALKPDLVIANKEENTKEDVEAIEGFCPIWTSDIVTIDDALDMIRDLGAITGTEKKALGITRQLEKGFREIRPVGKRAAYLIWKKPYMAAGGNTFINTMMNVAGIDNVFANQARYPEVTLEELRMANIELLLLSSEPYPFKMKDIEELTEILPKIKIILADGEMFSWYGSRLLRFPEYINGRDWHQA
jgi:ABC-type Fe3+-hydroxamate transport system substrate-binding protein